MSTVVTGLLWFSAVGCGLLGGLYFAFSAFIMTSLGRIDRAAGIAAMNAINTDIVRSLFMPLFLMTTLAGAALAVLAIVRWGEPGALAMLLGGIAYVLGMFVVTMAFNVPLNNALAAVAPSGAEAAGDLGALPQGLDLVEPRADGRLYGGDRALYRRDCGLTRGRAEAIRPEAPTSLDRGEDPALRLRQQ